MFLYLKLKPQIFITPSQPTTGVSSVAGTWELNGVPTLIELDSIDSLNARCMSASLQSPMAMFNGNPNPSSVVTHIEE